MSQLRHRPTGRPANVDPSRVGAAEAPADAPEKSKVKQRAGCCAQFKFYLRQTRIDVCSSKCSYCLGFCACMLVVIVSAVVMSVLSNAPVVFLRLAEASVGEIDLQVTPAGWTQHYGINYTLLATTLGAEGTYSYHAPRVTFTAQAYNVRLCDADAAALADSSKLDSQWTYPSSGLLPSCTNVTLTEYSSCLAAACESFTSSDIMASVYALDTDAERRMGLGRQYKFSALEPNTAIVHRGLARQLGLGIGDTLYLSIQVDGAVPALFFAAAKSYLAANPGNATNEASLSMRVNVPFVVSAFMATSLGKFASSESKGVIVELGPLLGALAAAADAQYPFPYAAMWGAMDLAQYADEVVVNMPAPRIAAYKHTDYDDIQRAVMEFASKAIYKIGFNQFTTDQPIVESLRGTRFFALFLGLILSIIIFILTGLSILLLFSLLTVNVEVRTFDLGVMRMIGMNKRGVLALLSMQAFAYSVPAYVVGMLAAQLIFWLLARVFANATAVDISPRLSTDGIILATVLGFLIPAVAAVFPVIRAFGLSLVESLNVQRSRTSAVKVSVDRSEDGAFSWPLVVVGLAITVFGFLIYYVLPLALLSFNLTLLLYIFFGVLIGMIIGLALLALNLQHLLERLFVGLFIGWWESSAVSTVVVKNLIAHRLSNRKTTLMYSISLAVIIFISVSFSLQIQTFVYQVRQSNGALLVVTDPGGKLPALEAILAADSNVRDWGFISYSLADLAVNASLHEITNVGQVFKAEVDCYAASPNLFTVALTGFLSVGSAPAGFGHQTLPAELYGERGSHSLMISTSYRPALGLVHLDQALVSDLTVTTAQGEGHFRYLLTPAAYVNSAPAFAFSKYPNADGLQVVVSYPTLGRLVGGGIPLERLGVRKVLIKIDEALGDAARDALVFKLRDFTVTDYRDEVAPLDAAATVLDYFFLFATVSAMLISFFSLTSSMYSNIYKQSKEIAVLRALGASRSRMVRIYVHEAFVLVFSSAFAGILIGVVVAWTMTLQRVLFVQLPIPFVFPWAILIAVLLASAVSALASSFWPIFRMVRKPIVTLFRTS